MIKQYEKDGGYEYEGVYYQSSEDLLQTGFLGFCGCGSPDDNLMYVLGGLSLINETYKKDKDDRYAFSVWYEDHQKKVNDHFKSRDGAYFFYYWADKEGYTDHGGSVPGWLTDKGEELLEILIEWRDNHKELNDV